MPGPKGTSGPGRHVTSGWIMLGNSQPGLTRAARQSKTALMAGFYDAGAQQTVFTMFYAFCTMKAVGRPARILRPVPACRRPGQRW